MTFEPHQNVVEYIADFAASKGADREEVLKRLTKTKRITIVGHDEPLPTPEVMQQYLKHQTHLPTNMTPLRCAERRFKRPNNEELKKWPLDRRTRRAWTSQMFAESDWSDVLDWRNPREDLMECVAVPPLSDSSFEEWRDLAQRPLVAYRLRHVPGIICIPNALTDAEQKSIMLTSIYNWFKKPFETNLDAHYHVPEHGLLSCLDEPGRLIAARSKVVFRDDSDEEEMENDKQPATATELLRKLRWSTFGQSYNWTTKSYDKVNDFPAVPKELVAITSILTHRLGWTEYRPEAGIVNIYKANKDSLGAHVDRSELDMKSPLVSISLGQTGLFILGGHDRNDPNIYPMFLKSGDILIMHDEARLRYHGIPRVLPETGPSWLTNRDEDSPEWNTAYPFIADTRMNINVRQVFP